jgi:hypothetical protein
MIKSGEATTKKASRCLRVNIFELENSIAISITAIATIAFCFPRNFNVLPPTVCIDTFIVLFPPLPKH